MQNLLLQDETQTSAVAGERRKAARRAEAPPGEPEKGRRAAVQAADTLTAIIELRASLQTHG